jgi:hypothetical protein
VNVFPFIAAEQAGKHNVKRSCELLEVSRSAYYQRKTGFQSTRQRVDVRLTDTITAVYAVSKGTYGRHGSTPISPKLGCGTAVNASPG